MYCKSCGGEVSQFASVCTHCGKSLRETPVKGNYSDPGGIGYGLLGFCIPIAGLVLWLVWKDEKPNNARAAGTGALVSFIIGFLFYFLGFIIALGGV